MQNKKLYRNPEQAKVAGVGSGLADFFEIDVTVIRLVLLALIIFSGILPGLLFYFLAVWLMPVKGEVDG